MDHDAIGQVTEALILVVTFYVIVGVPCFLIAFFGKKYVDQMGQFPLNMASLQLKLLLTVGPIGMIAFMLLLVFFKQFY